MTSMNRTNLLTNFTYLNLNEDQEPVNSLVLLEKRLNDTLENYDAFKLQMDDFFLVSMGLIIFTMLPGFAFLESGSVRSKNTTNIFIMNLLDAALGAIAFWIIGYAFGFGQGNKFIGYSYFFNIGLPKDRTSYWFFEYSFAATAATIVSGALAERCQFITYLIYNFLLTGFIYPVVTHWAWTSEGWLAVGNGEVTYADFAGSGVVHLLGGTAAFVGAILLGPRKGRIIHGELQDIPGHSITLVALGGFFLYFGVFAFNAGSQARISNLGDSFIVSRSVLNTAVSAGFGAVFVMLSCKLGLFNIKKWSLLMCLNGALAGMVSVCSGANVYASWMACAVGVIAAFQYLFWHWILIKFRIDDPVDAIPVHFGSGLWGVLAQPIFKEDTGIVYTGSRHAFLSFAWNLAGACSIIAWTGVLSIIMFGILKKLNLFRSEEEAEIEGLDSWEHGEPAYPTSAYSEPLLYKPTKPSAMMNMGDKSYFDSIEKKRSIPRPSGQSNNGYIPEDQTNL